MTIVKPEVPKLANSHAPWASSRNATQRWADTFRAVSTTKTSQADSATTPSMRSNTGWDDKRVFSTAHAATNVNSRSVTSGSVKSQNSVRRVAEPGVVMITRGD
jgi:predicted Zn-dependent protease